MTQQAYKNLINEIVNVVNDNYFEIRDRIAQYGYDRFMLSEIQNYYDIANILGMDSRLFAEIDLQEIADIIQEVFGDEME